MRVTECVSLGDDIIFELIIDYINYFFLFYIVGYAIIFFVSTVGAIIKLERRQLKKQYRNKMRIKGEKNYIPISVLVPAYNEVETIIDCLESNLYLDYPEFELIVINDGSSDETLELVKTHFNLKEIERPIRRIVPCKPVGAIFEGVVGDGIKLTLIDKENAGKADALNMGINAARYPLIISLDADSVLQYDSLTEITIPFMEDGRTVAVGGNVKVSNQVVLDKGRPVHYLTPKKFIVTMQLIEYYRVFLNTRVWLNEFNGNLIISGAFGLFRKDAVAAVGGYDVNTVGEDMDLVMKLHAYHRNNKLPYRIGYEPSAICWSQVPSSLRDLKNQRRRWQIGLMTTLFNHRYMIFNWNYGVIGMFSYLYFIIYEMFSCVIDVFGLFSMIVSYFCGFLNVSFLITFMIIYIVYNSAISIVAIKFEQYLFPGSLSRISKVKLILFSIFENLGYRQLMSLYRLSAFFRYSKQKKRWDKISRTSQNKVETENT